ncbi:MAG: DUF4340 domain-containing protein [Verrucomicrobia bacterium]|nr:DUF4340 domain-containing protein [Verrucomicrobiota bacterium]MDE3098653.1 DUF4340 domain-containing protein [Verrucomicrobiota bacterium]
MNQKQFTLLLALLLVLGAAAWWHSRIRSAAWVPSAGATPGAPLLGNFQVNDVSRIRILDRTNALDLHKVNGIWAVAQRSDYPADFSKISRFLIKLRDLKIVQAEPVTPEQLPQLDLAPPGQGTNSATLLAFYDAAGKPLRVLRLGSPHLHQSSGFQSDNWPDGRYVLTASNATSVAIITDPLSDAGTAPQSWLDKSFFTIRNPNSISARFPNPTNSWKVTRPGPANSWALADAKPGEKLDPSQVSSVAYGISSPSFDDAFPALTGVWSHPARVVVTTTNGFHYAITIGNKTNEAYYVKVQTSFTAPPAPAAGGKETPAQIAAAQKAYTASLKTLRDQFQQDTALARWTYLVPEWTIQPLLKHRFQLLLPNPKPAATKLPPVPAEKGSAGK